MRNYFQERRNIQFHGRVIKKQKTHGIGFLITPFQGANRKSEELFRVSKEFQQSKEKNRFK